MDNASRTATTNPTPDQPLKHHYHMLVDQGKIIADDVQIEALNELSTLKQHILAPPLPWWKKLFSKQAENTSIQGIYLYGSVGRGKSMLMDLFFHHIDVAKRRIHFHSFMMEVHTELKNLRQQQETTTSKEGHGHKDSLLAKVAKSIAARYRLLCFDELQVTNIADAMILGPLFKHLLDYNVTIVITSNREPETLYKDGLQRERFLPFISLLNTHLKVIKLDAKQDYRLGRLEHAQTTYFVPLGKEAETFMEDTFNLFTNHAEKEPITLTVNNRSLVFPYTYGDILLTDFNSLCATALGAADYQEIATNFSTLLLTDIPVLTSELKNEALRFITLIDILYEHQVKLICTAQASADTLLSDNLELFEFSRTVSRLSEMQSNSYWQQPHIGELKETTE